MHWLVFCGFMLGSFFIRIDSARAEMPETQMESRANAAVQRLQVFKASGSLDDLRSAINTMQSSLDLSEVTPQNFIATRRKQVGVWAQILKVIEQSYDPSYDPRDPASRPALCLQPPMESSGKQLPPCADPKSIQDPAARVAYVTALQENSRKIARAGSYHDLHVIDLNAMGILTSELRLLNRVAPENTPADSVALDGILRQSRISEARRAKIDAMFYARSGP